MSTANHHSERQWYKNSTMLCPALNESNKKTNIGNNYRDTIVQTGKFSRLVTYLKTQKILIFSFPFNKNKLLNNLKPRLSFFNFRAEPVRL